MGGEKINERFNNGIFPFDYDEVWEEQMRYEKEEEELNNIKKNGPIDFGRLNSLIGGKERDINDEFVKKHFLVHDLGHLLKNFKNSKTNPERNKIQVSLINKMDQ